MSMIQLYRDIINLISCVIKNRIPDRTVISRIDLEKAYSIAKRHTLSAIVAVALQSAGIKDKRNTEIIGRAIRKSALFSDAWKQIVSKLEKEGIWYLPLKGMVIKELYSSNWMRQMSDYDILIDPNRCADVRKIMESLGFTTEEFGAGSHDVYQKAPVLNFEMHETLFSKTFDEKIHDYYHNIKDHMVKDEGNGYGYHLSPEDFYVYMIAHEYKHYVLGGTGLRSLVDTYVYLKNMDFNLSYARQELAKMGIETFEEENRLLAQHLFDGQKLSDKEEEMLEYIIGSGTYGTITNNVQHSIDKRKGNKVSYVLRRFSVPVRKKNPNYRAYAAYYPVFYKYKVLLPFLPFYRLARGFKSGRTKAEIKAVRKAKGKRR